MGKTVAPQEEGSHYEVGVSLGYAEFLRLTRLDRGVFNIDSPILPGMSGCLLDEIRLMREAGVTEIQFILNSPGGEVGEMFAYHDIIKGLPATGITTTMMAVGTVASAAVLILCAAQKRYSLPNTNFMIHEIASMRGESRTAELEDDTRRTRGLQAQMLKLIAARAGKSVSVLEKAVSRKDFWMTALEAKKWGLIDAIKQSV